MTKAISISATSLSTAILQTVAYADVFDYPLTAAEIHRYLVGLRAELETVDDFLLGSSSLSRVEHYYTLPGRERLASLRRSREQNAIRLWPKALRYGMLIARLPFVRLVAVTGALAVNNVGGEADIDYLIVTEPGRLWSCRAMTLALRRLALLDKVTLCPNYLISTRSLRFPDRTLYAAHEIAQMVPLAGLDLYHQIRRQNSWADEFLPNAGGLPHSPLARQAIPRRLSRPALESAMRARPFTRFEQWEMQRKIRRLRLEQGDSPESHFSADCCKGHAFRHQTRTQAALSERLARIQEGVG